MFTLLRPVSSLVSRLAILFALISAAFLLNFAHAALERWEGGGPNAGYVRALVVVDVGATTKVNTIYAATWGGGVVSTTWDTFSNRWTGFVRDSSGLTNWRVYSIGYDSTSNKLYATTDGAGVWEATVPPALGTALTWTQLNTTGLNCMRSEISVPS